MNNCSNAIHMRDIDKTRIGKIAYRHDARGRHVMKQRVGGMLLGAASRA